MKSFDEHSFLSFVDVFWVGYIEGLVLYFKGTDVATDLFFLIVTYLDYRKRKKCRAGSWMETDLNASL